MDKKVYYCLPTYKSFDLAYESVLAALRGTKPPDHIAIIDNSGNGSGAQYLQPLTEKFANVYIWPRTTNIGVAASWNLFHKELPHDYVIIANDDIQVHPYTIERMVQAADQNTQQVFFSGEQYSGNAFSLFLLTKKGYNLIGAFDETFYPAYFEDNDYARRMMLKGYSIVSVHGATYLHEGSSTMKRYTQAEMDAHHNSFRRNHSYFVSKWGDEPGKTLYTELFGGII